MKLDFFKDIFFDLVNEWDAGVSDIRADDKTNTFWIHMLDGSVFRIQCEKEA